MIILPCQVPDPQPPSFQDRTPLFCSTTSETCYGGDGRGDVGSALTWSCGSSLAAVQARDYVTPQDDIVTNQDDHVDTPPFLSCQESFAPAHQPAPDDVHLAAAEDDGASAQTLHPAPWRNADLAGGADSSPPIPSSIAAPEHDSVAAYAAGSAENFARLTIESIKAMTSEQLAQQAAARAGIQVDDCVRALTGRVHGRTYKQDWTHEDLPELLATLPYFVVNTHHLQSVIDALVAMKQEAESHVPAAAEQQQPLSSAAEPKPVHPTPQSSSAPVDNHAPHAGDDDTLVEGWQQVRKQA